MLIWINGAHGAGKTSVARRLAALRADAFILDPEQIGFMLRRIWPEGGPPDFQDMPAWRELTVATLRAASADRPAATLVVPMTLANPLHHAEIIGGLRAAGMDVRHFTLLASPATLRRRIRRRLDWPLSRRWALSRVEACSAALEDPAFADHIATDGLGVAEVAAKILTRVEAAATAPRTAPAASGGMPPPHS
ncbi:MAG TPA: AAA family ATPase [Allosphingosinicella sp.]|nr:AAA family ATPase [Allosphingosinicella sp.]